MKGYVPQGLGKPIGYLFALSPLHVPPGHVVLGRGTCEPKAALETASCSERPLPICLPNELSIWHPILRVTKGRASLHLGRCHEALRCARLPGHPSMHAGTSQCASDFMTRKPAQTWEEGGKGPQPPPRQPGDASLGNEMEPPSCAHSGLCHQLSSFRQRLFRLQRVLFVIQTCVYAHLRLGRQK